LKQDHFDKRSKENGGTKYLAHFAVNSHLEGRRGPDKQRMKVGEGAPPQRPGGNWLGGIVIGPTILTMATQAMLIAITAAIGDFTLKGG
jgi:hypothetical protein